jgi:hypothetical protein
MVKGQKTISIACLGTPADYSTSLVPLMIQSLGYKIRWVRPVWADLLIYGSFYDVHAPRLRWLPRQWRVRVGLWVDWVEKELSKRKMPPVTLFHTAENLRHDHIKADYSISHDLNVQSDRHFRLPYWMEVIDWSHEGIVGNENPRYGELLKLERLQAPLGDQFLKRPQKAVLITSHLREPRAGCYKLLKQYLPIDGLGPYFDRTIRNHHQSGFLKRNILHSYAFNLCPENGIYPGYVTEKIPEAFAAGCLPISLVDERVGEDFNPDGFINLSKMMTNNKDGLGVTLKSKATLEKFAQQPLLLHVPSLAGAQKFIKKMVDDIW